MITRIGQCYRYDAQCVLRRKVKKIPLKPNETIEINSLWDVPTWNQWMIQTPVFCLIHDVVLVTFHFLVVYECIADGGEFLYRDSKCIVTVLIHSRHVEMVAGIHEGCSVPDRDRALSCFLLVELLVAFVDTSSLPTVWNRCQYSELFESDACSVEMVCDTFGKEESTDTNVYQVTADIGSNLGC